MRYSLLALAATTLLSSASAQGHNLHQRHGRLARRVAQADECVCSTYVTSYLVDHTPAPFPPVVANVNATTTIRSVMTVMPIHETTSSAVPSEDITTTLFSTWTSTYTATAFVTVTAVSSSTPVSVAPVVSVQPSSPIPPPAPMVPTPVSVTPVVSIPTSSPVLPPAPTVPTPAVTTFVTPGVYTIPATTLTLTSTEYVCVPATTSLAPGVQTYGGVTTVVETSTTVVCPLATVSVDNGVTTSVIYTTTYICPFAGTYTIGATTSTVTGTVTVPCEYPVPTAYPPGTYTQPEVITTITVTSEVVTCPFFNSGPTTTSETTTTPTAAATTATTATTATEATTTPTAAATTTTTTTAAPAAIITSSTSVAAIVSSATSSTVSSAAIVSSATSSTVSSAAPVQSAAGGTPWAVTYSPYDDDGSCRSQSSIDSDIALIAAKGIPNVRIYSTDCLGLEYVGAACEAHGLGMIMGIYIKAGGVSTGDDQVQDLITWGKWSQIIMLVIGNESVFNGFCSASDLAAYIVSVSNKVKSAGFTGPITTAEPMNIIQEYSSTLCSVVDVMGANIHPFFNAQTSADEAGTFVASQLALVEQTCGKTAWVLETGWPSAGTRNSAAIPGVDEQATAIAAILSSVGGKSALFTWRNDLWKVAGSFGVEQYFGCGGLL